VFLQNKHVHVPGRPGIISWLVTAALSIALFITALPVQATLLDTMHRDPIAPIILGVTGVLFVAIIGRISARYLGQPPVVGELVMGILLGNLAVPLGLDLIIVLREGPAIFDAIEQMLAGNSVEAATLSAFGGSSAMRISDLLQGPNGTELLHVVDAVDVFSRYGIIFLLFLVGLESSVDEMRRVGADSARVAVAGVLLPFFLGLAAMRVLLPDQPMHSALFIAATLVATSVGITARVLDDLGKSAAQETRVIIGAAVIDDILGLLMLAIVSGIVVSGGVDFTHMGLTVLVAVLFLAGAIFFGPYILRFIIGLFRKFDLIEAKMFVSYMFVMTLAWTANLAGLAAIIGAFTAGLILHDAYFIHWGAYKKHAYSIRDLIMPLEVILVPIFFVLMGIQVKLETFLNTESILMAVALLLVAVIGKLACGMAASRKVNRWTIGIGMMPRGEVGLIFAAIGHSLGVIDEMLFSAVVMMVIITTLATPMLLKLSARELN
jgi:Kef-type K+ transport system membrane component KefB